MQKLSKTTPQKRSHRIGITFLFGAGAESGADNFDMIDGEEYNEATVTKPRPEVLKALNQRFPSVKQSLLCPASFQTELDASFHSIALLRSELNRDESSFAKVFYYYWLCYFAIVDGVNRFFHLEEFQEPSKVLSRLIDYGKTLDKLDMSSAAAKRPNSYYSLINKWLKKHQEQYECLGVGTSNYFRFCEIVPPERNGKRGDRICYLNGRLDFFEFPKKYEVKKIRGRKEPDDLFFPFLFGQSYTKPIVDEAQIRHFNRFAQYLKRSRFLIVIGYGIGDSDDHINASIAKHIRQKNNYTIFVVADKGEEERVKKIFLKIKRMTSVHFVYWKKGDLPKSPSEVLNEVSTLVESFSDR